MFRTTYAVAAGVAILSCLAIATAVAAGSAPDTAPIITFTASGSFSNPPISGDDALRLAGEPFSVSIAVSAATPPSQSGPNWAVYNNLKLNGTVHSGLLGPSPVNIGSRTASLTQAINPGQYDLFTMQAPIVVVGINLTIKAPIAMPPGTIANQLLHPFSPVSLVPANATMSYSQSGLSTTLGISKGTLTGTIPGPAGVTP